MSKKKAFLHVYKRTSEPLRRFISKRVGQDQQIVDDIFQETMLAAYKGWDGFESKSKYLTWLCSISVHKIADYYRRNVNEQSRRIVPFLLDITELIPTKDLNPEEQMMLQSLAKHIRRCVALLPEDSRKIIELRYYKNASYRSIAEAVGISERAVEGKLYRAKKDLHVLLTAQGWTS